MLNNVEAGRKRFSERRCPEYPGPGLKALTGSPGHMWKPGDADKRQGYGLTACFHGYELTAQHRPEGPDRTDERRNLTPPTSTERGLLQSRSTSVFSVGIQGGMGGER